MNHFSKVILVLIIYQLENMKYNDIANFSGTSFHVVGALLN